MGQAQLTLAWCYFAKNSFSIDGYQNICTVCQSMQIFISETIMYLLLYHWKWQKAGVGPGNKAIVCFLRRRKMLQIYLPVVLWPKQISGVKWLAMAGCTEGCTSVPVNEKNPWCSHIGQHLYLYSICIYFATHKTCLCTNSMCKIIFECNNDPLILWSVSYATFTLSPCTVDPLHSKNWLFVPGIHGLGGGWRESYSDWLAWFWTTIYSTEHSKKL